METVKNDLDWAEMSPLMPPKRQYNVTMIVTKIEKGKPSICSEDLDFVE